MFLFALRIETVAYVCALLINIEIDIFFKFRHIHPKDHPRSKKITYLKTTVGDSYCGIQQ